MPDRPAEPPAPSPDDTFRQLLAECIEAMTRDGSGAIEPVLLAHPTHATALRERIAKLVRAGLLSTEPEPSAEIPEQLGDYRLLRRIGAGGMGVVYLAEQTSLRRTVALKLVRPEQRFFPGARDRFQREVEAVARLGDPGIVPIYAVGEAEGISFFTMEYVRGASLADVLAAVHGSAPDQLAGRDLAAAAAARAEQPLTEHLPELFLGTWVQACCRILVRMARAAQHAHERGVVHRDLKPSNAMVTPDGRILLLDFGLAAAEGTLRITRTGTQLGTLHYMAPEQLLDQPTDARTDVYALGVTLHEILALHPPFHAERAETLRQAVLGGDPRDLRAQNPDVPRDVETICRRAMDRDPARRYQTAAELADDLERFLAHRPIVARPASAMLRLRRSCQRHPTIATAVVLVLLAAITLPIVIQVVRKEEAAARTAAEASARQNLRDAADAIAQMVEQTRSTTMTTTPGLDPVRLRQLDDAMARLRSLARNNEADPAVQVLLCRGLIHSSQVRQQLGQHAEALAALEDAAPRLARLRAQAPDDAGLHTDHFSLGMGKAASWIALDKLPEATAAWQALVDEHRDLDVTTAPTSWLVALTTCHNNLSRMHTMQGDPERGFQELQLGLALDARVRATENTPAIVMDSCRMRLNLGTMFRNQGKLEEARREYLVAVADLEPLFAKEPLDPELKRELARARFGVAQIASRRKDPTEATTYRNAAQTAQRELVAAFPDRVAYLQELGMMQFQTSCDLQLEGDLSGAEQQIQAAIENHERLVARRGTAAEPRTELSTFLRQQSGLQFARKQSQAALATIDRAITIQTAVVTDAPKDPHHRIELAGLQQELGIYHWREERWQAARDAWRGAATSYEHALASGARQVLDRRRLPMVLQVLAQAELMSDDFDGVVAALSRLQKAAPLPAAELRDAGQALHVADHQGFQQLLASTEAQEQAKKAKK